MSPDLVLLLILLLGAGSAVVLMAIAAVRGRRRPEHRVPWILALVGLGAPALFITAAAVGSALQVGIVWWIVVGAVGLWALFVLALLNPFWGAWMTMGFALVLPGLLWLGELVAGLPLEVDIPHAIGFYTVRSVVIGGLLLWAAHTRPDRSAERHPMVVIPAG